MSNSPKQSRRNTLGLILWSSLGAVALPVLYVAGRFLRPPRPQSSMAMVGKEGEIGPDAAQIVKVGMTDAVVMRDRQGELYALNLRCTHAGCNVRWRQSDGIFACPCHGGRFARDGALLKGPPKLPLQRLEIRVEDGSVIVTDIPA
jgi:cytochrome b6-f complex iron-sulfur subunit